MTHADTRRIRVGILGYGLDRPATGIARYTIEITRALAALHPEIEPVLLQPFETTIPALSNLERVRLRFIRLLPGLMAIGPVELALAARRHKLDVLHDPVGIAPFIAPRQLGGCATVVTIHDVVPFVHPETHARLTNFLYRRYMPVTLRFVDRVITDSDASKRDIMRFYHRRASDIERIQCGVGPLFQPQSTGHVTKVLAKYRICPPYILCVGALSARKNLETALTAFSIVRSRGFDHQLILVGPKAWKTQGIFQRIEELNLANHVSFTGFVDDEDLPAMYAGADCFVFPSIYEGFGLPPLEAMACGAPVVASNASSLPEVIGDAGLSVDPLDATGFADAICRVLTEPTLANTLRERGIARSQRFSWSRAAADHAKLYRSVVRDKECVTE